MSRRQAILREIENAPSPLSEAYRRLIGNFYTFPLASMGDGSFHSCRPGRFPRSVEKEISLQSGRPMFYGDSSLWSAHVFSNEVSDSELQVFRPHVRRLYKQLPWDMQLFEKAVGVSRAQWPKYVFKHTAAPRSKFDKARIEIPEDTAGDRNIRLVLALAPNSYPQMLEEVSSTVWNDFKYLRWVDNSRIYATLRTKDRFSILGAMLMQEFARINYKCMHDEKTRCLVCNQMFWPHTSSYGIAEGYLGLVCSSCAIRSLAFMTSSRDLDTYWALSVFGIRNWVERFGFIPMGDLAPGPVQLTPELTASSEEIRNVVKSSLLLPQRGSDLFKKAVGSWAELLNEANLLSKMRRGRGGYQSFASDNHHCFSIGERTICEYLTSLNIQHDKEPFYPQDPELNPNGRMRADFAIEGKFIEFAGRMQDEEYAQKIGNKDLLARKYGLKVLTLEPKDLDSLGQKIQSFLNK